MPFPSKRSPELEAAIIDRLSRGEPLAQICRDEGMPTPNGFRDWTKSDETLAIAYARAREDGFDQIAAEALLIADTQEMGEIVTIEGDKETIKREDMLGHRKLKIETRLKLLAKWDPKRFGDKIDVNHRGAVAQPATKLSDDPNEAARQYRDLMAGLDGEE